MDILKIKKEWKISILTTFIAGMAAHGYKFLNNLYNWDSIYAVYSDLDNVTSARGILKYAGSISSYYNVPWLIGIISLLYLACTSVLLLELFQLKKTCSIIIAAALLAVFPAVTSTFAYMPWADAYLLSMLLAALSVYATVKYRRGWIWGSLCICLSYGIYQANISFALLIMIVLLLDESASDSYDFSIYVKHIICFAVMVVLGSLFYYAMYNIQIKINHLQLGSYQGISSVGILSAKGYLDSAKKMVISCGGFLIGSKIKILNIYMLLNMIILLILFLMIMVWIIKRKIYKDVFKLMWIVFLFACIPVALHIYYFISPDVSYHMLMKMSFYFIYFMVVLGLDNLEIVKRRNTFAISVILLGLIYYHIVNANVAYFRMQSSYEKAYSQTQMIVNRISYLEGIDFNENNSIAIVSGYEAREENYRNIPGLTGMTDTNFLIEPGHYASMLNNYLGFNCKLVSDKELDQLKETEEYKNMMAFPASNSVSYINGIVVVKLSGN